MRSLAAQGRLGVGVGARARACASEIQQVASRPHCVGAELRAFGLRNFGDALARARRQRHSPIHSFHHSNRPH
eukprot:2046058-Pleurochrysis_carterae.AAC.1